MKSGNFTPKKIVLIIAVIVLVILIMQTFFSNDSKPSDMNQNPALSHDVMTAPGPMPASPAEDPNMVNPAAPASTTPVAPDTTAPGMENPAMSAPAMQPAAPENVPTAATPDAPASVIAPAPTTTPTTQQP